MMREILVIDCEGDKSCWTALKSNHKILFAATAREGLGILSENVGLVFLDLRLPDMNGIEALKFIKREYPSTAVIIITSYGTEETCIEAFRKGAKDYMRKPLKNDEILQKITLFMNKSDASQRHPYVSLSTEIIRDEHYSNIPFHLVDGVLKVRDFIAQNYSESLTLSSACRMASLCKTYFCRFFKRITGHSLRSYYHVVRVRMAEELLQDKRLSIADVATRLGYDDPNYFSTIYKKITGASPKQWQASHQNRHGSRERPGQAKVPAPNLSMSQPESGHRKNMPREWQMSYKNLYCRKEETAAFEDLMSTITFAEAGEHEKAKEFLRERKKDIAMSRKSLLNQAESEYQSVLREWQDSYLPLYSIEAGAGGIAWNRKAFLNQAESEYQNALREWQDSYYPLHGMKAGEQGLA